MRRVDEDRWLASRFANAAQRARLMSLYALNYEIARVAETIREPALGDIRFAWWRDALDPGARLAHPTLQAFLALWPEPAARETMQRMIAARRGADLSPTPFGSLDAMETYCDETAGALISVAALGCGAELDPAFADAAGRAWGLSGLLRAAPHWAARGRTLLPPGVNEKALVERALLAHERARDLSRRARADTFAAYGYVTFAPLYLRSAQPGLLTRQVRLVFAAASGRL